MLFARAPRRLISRPVLVREAGSLRCWNATMVNWSLTGSKLAGFPPIGGLKKDMELELIEGLDVDAFKKIAPLLASPDVKKFNATVNRIGMQIGLRRSNGKIVRIEPHLKQFAIEFATVSDDGRSYPLAQSRKPPLKASFTYQDKVGVFEVKGLMTPGAAIDLAKDVVNDIRQCLVIVDLSTLTELGRIAIEKFCTRLRSELNEQDLSYSLAIVCPFEWVLDVIGEIQGFMTLAEAKEALQRGLSGMDNAAPDIAKEETESVKEEDNKEDKEAKEEEAAKPEDSQAKESDDKGDSKTDTEDAKEKNADDSGQDSEKPSD